jgi:hypothetical protein
MPDGTEHLPGTVVAEQPPQAVAGERVGGAAAGIAHITPLLNATISWTGKTSPYDQNTEPNNQRQEQQQKDPERTLLAHNAFPYALGLGRSCSPQTGQGMLMRKKILYLAVHARTTSTGGQLGQSVVSVAR